MTYVKEGTLSDIVDGESINVKKPQLLICSSYAVHTYKTEEKSQIVVLAVPLSSVPSLQKK